MEYRIWCKKALSWAAVIFVLMGLIAYLVDPLFVYRYQDGGSYWIQPEQTSIGLVKNGDYDTILIGSSVTQNFNAGTFGQAVGGKVLKVNGGGLSVTEMEGYLKLIQTVGKAEKCYVCLDLHQFAKSREEDVYRLKDYLLDDSIWNDYQYLLGYETWMRFIPLDGALTAMKLLGIPYPERIALKTDVDRAGEWAGDYQYSREQVISDYHNGVNQVSAVDGEDLYGRMTRRIDEFLACIDFDSGVEYTFFFAPYSALYWSGVRQDGNYDTFLAVKAYLEEQILAREHTEIVDFQAEDYISDLDNYRDPSHYGPAITDEMTRVFAGDSLRVTTQEEGVALMEQQREIIDTFDRDNQDWLFLATENK